MEHGCRGVFLEAEGDENGNSNLSEGTVQFLTEKLMEFINLKYSVYKYDEIESVCKAACTIFPSVPMVNEFRTQSSIFSY